MTTVGLHLDAKPPYVRGFYGRTYDVTGGVKAVDKWLVQLSQVGARPDNEDYDMLLDARNILAARAKALDELTKLGQEQVAGGFEETR